MRRLLLFLLTVLFAVTAIWLAASPALAVDNGQIGIQPSDEPDYFHVDVAPGTAVQRAAIISNHTSRPVSLLTYPVDGLTTPQGGFGFAAQTDPRKNVGAWVKLDVSQVTVPPDSQIRLPFRLTVPTGVTPGDYYGGLVIQSPTVVGKAVVVHGGTAVQLNIVQRQAVRIYLTVAGTRHNQLQNGHLSSKENGGEVDFSLPLYNIGNTALHPMGTLELHSVVGANEKLRFNTPESLLPGESITLHATLQHASPVEVGTATVSEHSEAGNTRFTTGFTYIPWMVLVALAAAIGLLTVLSVRLTRFLRRARRAIALVESGSAESIQQR